MSNPDILIIGAGPVGLTMANQCSRYGMSFRIIEKRAKPSKESRALAIHTRTLELLHFLDLGPTFAKKGLPIKKFSIFINNKKEVEIPTNRLESPYSYVLSLDQSDTERILENNLNKKGIRVERKKELISLRENTKGIKAILKSSKGKKEILSPRFVIACDGAHSTVRKQLHLNFEGSQYQTRLILADLDIDWPGKPRKDFQAYMDKNGTCAFIPLRHRGRYRFIATVSKNFNKPTLESIKKIVQSKNIQGIKLSNPIWITPFKIHHRIIPSLRKGNIFLLGDAAHIHSPLGGQGMNIGMQETGNLAWKLKLVLDRSVSENLLDTFNEERYPIIKTIIRTTDISTKIFFSKNVLLEKLKKIAFSIIDSSKMLKKKINKMLSGVIINYTSSSIVSENWKTKGGISAGERALPTSLPLKKSHFQLFDLLKSEKHTLLIFTPNSNTIKKFTKHFSKLSTIYNITKISKELTKKYGILKEGIYIIRPDGYVGFRSDFIDEKGCEHYFKTLCNL